MEDKLKKMNKDNRIRLINSAMKEFGANRFDKASTNVIVKEANISKGLLFHYFKTKEALFDYLVFFTISKMGNAIVDQVDWTDGDLINRMQTIIKIKLGILQKYPHMLSFSKNIYERISIAELKQLTDKLIPDLYYQIYSHNIDYSLFKEEYEVESVINIIQLFLDGFAEQQQQKYKDTPLINENLEKEIKEIEKYLSIYKQAFYKKSD